MVALRDFNAQSSSWYNKYNTSNEGRKIKAVTLINESKHILDNSTS